MRLQPKQSWRIGKHRSWVRSRESFSFQKIEKDLGVTPAHFRVGLTFQRCVSKVTPAFDYLLRRAAAYTQLQPAVAYQVGCACILEHVEGILVPHVNYGGSHLDARRSGA